MGEPAAVGDAVGLGDGAIGVGENVGTTVTVAVRVATLTVAEGDGERSGVRVGDDRAAVGVGEL